MKAAEHMLLLVDYETEAGDANAEMHAGIVEAIKRDAQEAQERGL